MDVGDGDALALFIKTGEPARIAVDQFDGARDNCAK